MRLATATDHALLLHWRKHGDPAAFAKLVDRHAAMVHSASLRVVHNRALAQEVAQETFLKLTQLDQFDGASVGGWLHRVATNRALDVAKAESRRHARDEAFAATREAATSPEAAAVLAEVDGALSALPEDLRELIVLHYLEGATHKEIARRLGTSRPTVTRKIQVALEQLREKLGARGVAGSTAAILAVLESAYATAAPAALIAALRKLGLRPSMPAATPALTVTPTMLVAAGAVALLLFLAAILVPRLVGANSYRATEPAPVAQAPVAQPSESPAPTAASVAETPPPPSPADALVAVQTPRAQEDALETNDPIDAPSDALVIKCLDPNDQPVSGAEVFLVRSPTSAKPGIGYVDPSGELSEIHGPFLSDGIGRVTLPPLRGPAASEMVRYSAYGRVPGKLVGAWSRVMGYPPGSADDIMFMTPTRRFEGTVTVPRGFDVTKVVIRPDLVIARGGNAPQGSFFGIPLDRDDVPIPSLATRSPDANGKFIIDDAPASGSVAVEFLCAGLAGVRAHFGDQTPVEEIKIELIPESVIYGTVRNKITGAPIPNVEVTARSLGMTNSSGYAAPVRIVSDQQGRYRIDGLYEEKYRVLALPIGNPPTLAAPVVTQVNVGRSAETGPIDLWFDQGGWVEGVAREKTSGAPIDGVAIRAVNPDMDEFNPGEAVDGAITADGGRYRVYLPQGASMLYISRVPAQYPYPENQARQTVNIGPDQSASVRVDFVLGDPVPVQRPGVAFVTGLVKDSKGTPLEGVPIWDQEKKKPDEQWPTRWYLGRTNRDGAFRFPVTATGLHAVEIGGGNGEPFPRADLHFSSVVKPDITPEADKTYDLGETVVERYTGSIGGRVIDASGAPIVSATVYLEAVPEIAGFPGVSDEVANDGAFVLRYTPPGVFRLRAQADGFETTVVDAEPGFDYEITLKPFPARQEN